MKQSSKNSAQKESPASRLVGMQSSQVSKLFEEGLGDIYRAEEALTKALPKMLKKASSPELIDALATHLAETEAHVKRLDLIYEFLDKKPIIKNCEAMEALIQETDEIMESCEAGPMCDACIISAGQKVEHYEIASYGSLRQFAQTLELSKVVELLQENLNDEKAADEKLSEIATLIFSVDAAAEEVVVS